MYIGRSWGKRNHLHQKGSIHCIVFEIVEDKRYFIMLDKKIFTRSNNLHESLLILIAIYFVFNKKYISHHPCTLLFVQMFLLSISLNNKICRAGSETIKRKVLTLIRQLKNIETKKKKTKRTSNKKV